MSPSTVRIVSRQRMGYVTFYDLSSGWRIDSSHATSQTGFAGFQLRDKSLALRGEFKQLKAALAAAEGEKP